MSRWKGAGGVKREVKKHRGILLIQPFLRSEKVARICGLQMAGGHNRFLVYTVKKLVVTRKFFFFFL